MTLDASGAAAEHSLASGDPLCALLAASSPAESLALLPSGVRRAGELAEQLREAVRLRAGTTEPLLVELVAAMDSAAEAHERFVATWSETTVLSELTQGVLEEDVCTLTGTWASVIRVVGPPAGAE